MHIVHLSLAHIERVTITSLLSTSVAADMLSVKIVQCEREKQLLQCLLTATLDLNYINNEKKHAMDRLTSYVKSYKLTTLSTHRNSQLQTDNRHSKINYFNIRTTVHSKSPVGRGIGVSNCTLWSCPVEVAATSHRTQLHMGTKQRLNQPCSQDFCQWGRQ